MTAVAWADPDTGLPADDPGGPLTEWSDPVPQTPPAPATTSADLDALLYAALVGDGAAVLGLADWLGERVDGLLAGGDVMFAAAKVDGRYVFLRAYRSREQPDLLWAVLTGGTPMRMCRFHPDDFAARFAAWFLGA